MSNNANGSTAAAATPDGDDGDDIFDFEPNGESDNVVVNPAYEKEHDEKILTDDHAMKLVDASTGDYFTKLIVHSSPTSSGINHQDLDIVEISPSNNASSRYVPHAWLSKLKSEPTTEEHEENAFDKLEVTPDSAEKTEITIKNSKIERESRGSGRDMEDDDEQLDDEDIYDKFVPTDQSKIQEYERKYHDEKNKVHPIEEYIITEPSEKPGEDPKIRINRPIGMYTPPENFAMVSRSIYRSSFPRVENFKFLSTLHLKSIICLIPEAYPPENIEFNERNGIKFFQIGLSGNKEPFVKIKPELVTEALKIIANPENQPILIHCNRGKHRTGCIVGCVRKLQNWSLSMIFDEYRKFAYPKERPLDQQFIEMYDDSGISEYARKRHWLPLRW